jgi:hypothetical protein
MSRSCLWSRLLWASSTYSAAWLTAALPGGWLQDPLRLPLDAPPSPCPEAIGTLVLEEPGQSSRCHWDAAPIPMGHLVGYTLLRGWHHAAETSAALQKGRQTGE